MDQAEREKRIQYARNRFEVHKAYANYWQAMATTGAATLRDISRAGVQLTDEEKTKEALATMLRHIHFMDECNDTINELL